MAPKKRTKSKTRRSRKSAWNHGNGFSTFSIIKSASAVGFSPTLLYHILHDDLHVKPYKYQEWHKLEEYDYEKKVKFAQFFLLRPQNNKYFLIRSYEAYFYLSLSFNKPNNRIWNDSRPLEGIELPLHYQKVLVKCIFKVWKKDAI